MIAARRVTPRDVSIGPSAVLLRQVLRRVELEDGLQLCEVLAILLSASHSTDLMFASILAPRSSATTIACVLDKPSMARVLYRLVN